MKKTLLLLCLVCTLTQAYAWKPLFAGHRGSYRGVENTEEAMMNGINHYGYTGLEIDVKTTSDGEYVCWHDDDLSRVGHNVSIPYSNDGCIEVKMRASSTKPCFSINLYKPGKRLISLLLIPTAHLSSMIGNTLFSLQISK